MAAFDATAYVTRVALLGPTNLKPAEVVEWTLQGWPLFTDLEDGAILEEMAAKRLANAAGFASNALVAGDKLAAATFDHLYGPFAHQIPVESLTPSAPADTASAVEAIPAYISLRLDKAAPQGCAVIPGSTPVISFGDVRHAFVASLGLNPEPDGISRH